VERQSIFQRSTAGPSRATLTKSVTFRLDAFREDDNDKDDDNDNDYDEKGKGKGKMFSGSGLTRNNSSSTAHSVFDPVNPPVHLPSWSSLLHPVSTWLANPLLGLSRGAVLILIVYGLWNTIWLFAFSSVVTNLRRAGFISVAQYPISFALGTKNSLVGLFVGRSYEKLNYLHRWVGRIMYAACVFHVVGYLVLWTKQGILTDQLKLTQRDWATTAFGAMSLCALLSMPIVRRNTYAIFYHSHWIGFSVMLLATYYHVKSTLPYVLSSFLIYLIDMMARFYKSHYTTATLYTMPELNTTFLEVPSLSSGWRTGQHVRLRILSTQMGWFRWAEPHPFTIASIPTRKRTGGLQLYIKKSGDWTKALYQMAGMHEGGDVEGGEGAARRRRETVIGRGKRVKVIIEGPYGGTGNAIVSSFSAALIVVAGSGITFALANIRDIIKAASRGSSRIRILDMVWVVQDSRSVVPLLPTLSGLLLRAERTQTIEFVISIYYTRAPSASEAAMSYTVPRSLTINSGRPDLGTIAKLTVAKTAQLKTEGNHGVLMASCGPPSLNEDVRKAAVDSCVDKAMRQKIGGVEIHEEAFTW
jgi:hypothetical protein